MTSESDIEALARQLVERAAKKGRMLATAESCTGGLIAAAITGIAGSSAVFDRGLVTYSNAAKQGMAGVRSETLERHGAVSAETAVEMAEGALNRSLADVALSVTGIAGPGGGSPEKPVGLVFIGVAATNTSTTVAEFRFGAIGREAVRRKTVREGLKALITAVG